MGDTSTIRTVWNHDEVEALVRQGWETQDIGHCQRDVCWFMAPPKPPTLAEQMRSRYDELIQDGNSEECAGLYRQVADALEHYERVEAAADKMQEEQSQ